MRTNVLSRHVRSIRRGGARELRVEALAADQYFAQWSRFSQAQRTNALM
jgi:hypothetical protein